MNLSSKLRTSAAAATFVFAAGTANAVSVDTALSLAIDVSGSISTSEYNLQMDGYANAFRDAAIQAAILDMSNGRLGQIVVNVVKFASDAAEQVGFTLLDSVASINAFADTLDTLARQPATNVGGNTSPTDGINVAHGTITSWLATTGNSATRTVIDVSGDGQENQGGDLSGASAAACGGSVTAINAIAIGSSSLKTYFENNAICGPNSFALQASDFVAFEAAITNKLKFEITGTGPDPIPLPAAGWLLIAGVGGLAAMGRKKKKA